MPQHVAVIGYGTTAHSHARYFQQHGFVLDTTIGRLPDQTAAFAHELGFQHHSTDLAEALARPKLDLVVICSPSAAHEQQTEAALLAGKHVLVEIPLAMSFAGAQRLVTLAHQRSLTLMVAHTHRYQPGMLATKHLIASGQLTVHHIVSRYVFLRRENVDWTGRKRSWTDNLLWHHGCHATDMCLWLLGETQSGDVEVTAQVARPDPHMGIPMDLGILLRTRSDALASVNMSYNSHLSLYDYLIIGHEGSVLLSNGKVVEAKGSCANLQVPVDAQVAHDLQNAEFVAAVAERRPAAISGDSVLPAMWALQQVQEAWDRWQR
jgi:2-hydroxy-4-carboxymuconate semialdehyde hemiacetal dehydrogenase